MRTRLNILVGLVGLLFALALPTLAHHSFAAEFDAKDPVKLRGTVTKMEWINPHAWLWIDVKEADGKVTSWGIECGTPNTLLRRGLTKTSILTGTEVLVDGYRAKDGTNRANGRDVTLPDGKKLFLGAAETPDSAEGSSNK